MQFIVNTPRLTASARTAMADLELDHLAILYPGAKALPLGDRASALPLRTLSERRPEFWPS